MTQVTHSLEDTKPAGLQSPVSGALGLPPWPERPPDAPANPHDHSTLMLFDRWKHDQAMIAALRARLELLMGTIGDLTNGSAFTLEQFNEIIAACREPKP